MYGDFFLLEEEGQEPVKAKRLEFGETSGRDEAWLRDTLFEHPEILPVQDIDPSFGPLIPLCKELRTETGPLDIAFLNPFGRLTLVECKLWRNPEARRKVVAQVLDYARAVSRWSYSDLQRQVAAATKRAGNIPFELAKEANPDLVEHRFVDDVYKAMRSGKFLLLIAGDGIRRDVSAMTELINNNAASGFTFGLVEVALYGFKDGKLAVHPRTVAKTQIIERTVVIVHDGEKEPLRLSDESETESVNISRHELYREWWSPILDMTFDDPDQPPPVLYYPNNVRVSLPWPKVWILSYNMANGRTGVCTAGSGDSYSSAIENLEPYRSEVLSELPHDSTFEQFTTSDGYTYKVERLASEFSGEDEQKVWLADMINAFVNVLRPRLKKLVPNHTNI